MDEISLLLILGISLAATILAVLLERLIMLMGWTPGDTRCLIVIVFSFSVLFQLYDFGLGRYKLIAILIFAILISLRINRSYIMGTGKKGTWWWKSEVESKFDE